MRRIIAIHFDPRGGAPYWLERQRELGIDAHRAVVDAASLERLGPMDEDALRERPVLDFLPRSRRDRLAGAIIPSTGGTTGKPKRTLFTREEFHAAFVQPFVRVADAAGFPRAAPWLWVGPSGPHVIGQAASACAAAMGSPQPFSVDFDPRWFRKMPADSLARQRYLDHLVEQAMDILAREPIAVLFTTPVLLERLAGVMTPGQRERIRGVHYGGMRVSGELLSNAQEAWFPRAVHLAGYGNSLFGVCMELGGRSDRALRYYPFGLRLHVRVGDDGHVWMSRLDESVLILNLRERDVAIPASPPADAAWADFGPGIEDPHPPELEAPGKGIGIY